MKKITVADYVASRLHDLGITDVFGVPGDYAFPINDAICEHKKLRWIGSSNELNATYSADGYARVKGFGAVCTTYGAGELCGFGGLAAAYAEYVPLIYLVGMPKQSEDGSGKVLHHMLGDHPHNIFNKMADAITCASTVLNTHNCVLELERVLAAAERYHRPVYIGIPEDIAQKEVEVPKKVPASLSDPTSDRATLKDVVDEIEKRLNDAKTACILPGILVSRWGIQKLATQVINMTGLPYATGIMDKSTIDETHPSYMGMYLGKLGNEPVRKYVESCDCVLGIGVLANAFNTGMFTAEINRSISINILPHEVRIGNAIYEKVEMREVLMTLKNRMLKKMQYKWPVAKDVLKGIKGSSKAKISERIMTKRFEKFILPNDIVINDAGGSMFSGILFNLPQRVKMEIPALWSAIGWGTPAAFGAAIAAPGRRVVVVCGDGGFQITGQEVGQFYRYGLKPVFLIINNDGFQTERMLCKDPEKEYNDVAKWEYSKLPAALGCKGWITQKVTTIGELDTALGMANKAKEGVFIEVVTGKYDFPSPIGESLFAAKRKEYKQSLTLEKLKKTKVKA